jgi:hypothetical protein
MRKFATLLLITSFNLSLFSQEVILDTKLDKLNSKIDYILNSNEELFIMNSNKRVVDFHIYNNIKKLENGTFREILKDEEFLYFFPIVQSDNFMLVNGKPYGKLNLNFYLNGNKKSKNDIKNNDFYAYYFDYKNFKLSDKFMYEVVSKSEKNFNTGNKIENEDLYLLKFDINTFKTSKVKIDKPNISRLKNDTIYNQKVIAYLPEKIDNDNFQIITKSVDNKFNSSVFYRSIYDMSGKIIHEKSYTIKPIDGSFGYLYNKYTDRNMSNSTNESTINIPAYDLDINSHYLDKTTGDFFIFGGTHYENKRNGFYVYKFNKEEELVWKKFIKVNDSKGFGKNNNNIWTTYSLNSYDISDDEIVFCAKGPLDFKDSNAHVFKLSKSNGDVNAYSMFTYSINKNLGGFSTFRSSLFDNIILSKKKYANLELLIAQELNPEIKKFVSSISDKKGEDDKHIHAKITKNGIFVFETDNESYYKIVKF